MVYCLSDTATWNKLVTLFLQCLLDSKKIDSPIFLFSGTKVPIIRTVGPGRDQKIYFTIYFTIPAQYICITVCNKVCIQMKLITSKSDEQIVI